MTTDLIPPSALEGLMKKTFVEQGTSAGLFWDALLKANLYAPLVKGTEPAHWESDTEDLDDYPLLLGSDSEGKNIVWLFTSPSALKAYIEDDLPSLELPARQLFGKVSDIDYDIVLIGPEGITLGLHPELIQNLAEGKVPEGGDQKIRFVPKDTKVSVTVPTEDTTVLEGAFTTLFRSLPQVLEACFVEITDDLGTRLLLGLRLEAETRDALRKMAESITRAAEGVLDKGKTMDITLMNGTLKPAFDKYGKVFYKK
jgi:hypothetical protein